MGRKGIWNFIGREVAFWLSGDGAVKWALASERLRGNAQASGRSLICVTLDKGSPRPGKIFFVGVSGSFFLPATIQVKDINFASPGETNVKMEIRGEVTGYVETYDGLSIRRALLLIESLEGRFAFESVPNLQALKRKYEAQAARLETFVFEVIKRIKQSGRFVNLLEWMVGEMEGEGLILSRWGRSEFSALEASCRSTSKRRKTKRHGRLRRAVSDLDVDL